jgi:enediyne biosynthesis protein E4
VATADYDRDGRVDLLITNGYKDAQGRIELLRNRTASGHWIAVELVGGRRNPFALGARVHVRTDRLSYWREVTDGASFRSQSEVNPVHLGIGRARVARVRVRWPGGAESCFRAPAGARIRVDRRDHPC